MPPQTPIGQVWPIRCEASGTTDDDRSFYATRVVATRGLEDTLRLHGPQHRGFVSDNR